MIEINNKHICESCFAEITAEPCGCCGFSKSGYINDPSVLPCGSILMGRYIIGKTLGKGGFGITYLAYDIRTDKTVAVKEFYPNGIANRTTGNPTVTVSTAEDANVFQKGAEKFYNEAKLVARFNGNPGIVSVYEFFYENDTVYFSMEYLHGKTLKRHLDENGAITEAQAVSIADSVSSALLAAHSANVMHRDISPDNIMLCDDGTVKIIDFGAARQFVSQGSQNLSVILKQGFAPIEQYQRKGKQGPWTDIYSLGATLYYALTLDTIDDPMSRMEDDTEFQSNKYGISEPLWEVIRTSVMLKAAERYQDIFLFRKALGATGIMPVPIVAPKSVETEPAPVFQTAKPFYTHIANTSSPLSATTAIEQTPPQASAPLSATTAIEQPVAQQPIAVQPAPITAQPEPIAAPAPIPLTEAAYAQPPQTNERLGVTVALDTPDFQSAQPVQQKAKPAGKKIAIIAGVAAAVVVSVIVLVVSLISGNNDGISTTQSGNNSSQSKPTITTTTTTSKPAEPESKPVSEPEKVDKVWIAGEYTSVNIKSLDLSGKNLTSADIKNLKYMTSLTRISLNDNYIDNLSVLGKIPTLVEIEASNNAISDISFAKNLPNLIVLIMNSNNITDISPLKNCTKLKKLWLCDNAVKDISALKGKNLVELGLNNSPIGDISVLKEMNSLYNLCLYNCGISDISALSACISLVDVTLSYNYISDYSPLVELKYLGTVYLDGNIMDSNIITTLYGMKVYSELYLRDMGITEEMGYALAENIYSDNYDGATIWWG